MQLGEWMKAEGLTDAALAARLAEHDPVLQKSRVTVGRYRRGLEPVPGQVVKALVEMSKGAMTANELLGINSELVGEQA